MPTRKNTRRATPRTSTTPSHDTADGFAAQTSEELDRELAFQRAAYEQVILPNLRGWAAVLLGGENPLPVEQRHPPAASGLAVALPIWLKLWELWLRRAVRELTDAERRVLAPFLPPETWSWFLPTPPTVVEQSLWGEAGQP